MSGSMWPWCSLHILPAGRRQAVWKWPQRCPQGPGVHLTLVSKQDRTEPRSKLPPSGRKQRPVCVCSWMYLLWVISTSEVICNENQPQLWASGPDSGLRQHRPTVCLQLQTQQEGRQRRSSEQSNEAFSTFHQTLSRETQIISNSSPSSQQQQRNNDQQKTILYRWMTRRGPARCHSAASTELPWFDLCPQWSRSDCVDRIQSVFLYTEPASPANRKHHCVWK